MITACGTRTGDGAGHPRQRRFVVDRWDTLWAVGARDSVLLNPYLLAASGPAVYVYDGGARRVLAFSPHDGHLLWKFGREGAGPDEFRGVRDIKAAPGGGVLVLDPRNNRVVHLDSAGHATARIPLDAVGHAEQMAPLRNGNIVLLTMSPESAFAVLDPAGRVERRFSLPWRGFAALDPLVRQGFMAARDGQWVFGFSVGDGWYAYTGTSPARFSGRYVEHTDFPRMETSADGSTTVAQLQGYNACSGCSLSVSGPLLWVHFGGYGESPRRTLDRYEMSTGRYLDSYRLPTQAKAVEVDGDRVYAIVEDPYPVLLALKPHA